jgi:hypothetical protein
VPLPAAETVTDPASSTALEERMQRDQSIAALRIEISALLGCVARLEAEISALRSGAEPVRALALTQLQNDLKKLKDSMDPLQEDVRTLTEPA